MRTIAVVGAGPLVGLSTAKKFGSNGFRVALIARRRGALDDYVTQLKEQGIEAAAFPADITNPQQLADAFSGIKRTFGSVDVLIFSPTDWRIDNEKNNFAMAITPDVVLQDFKLLVLGAISCVQHVLLDMLEHTQGAILFTTGYSAIKPLPFIASLGISNSGLRNYAYCLHENLGPKGIYVGIIPINVYIAPNTDGDPDKIASLIYDMCKKRDRIETVFGPTDR